MSEGMAPEVNAEALAYKTGHTKTWNETWRQLYDQFGGAIMAYARRRGLDESSAQDVLQEVMATVIRSQNGEAKGYDQKGGVFQAWLWGVIRHRLLEAFRRAHKTPPFEPEQNADGEEAGNRGQLGAVLPPDYTEKEEEEWQRAILDAAMESVRARVGPQTFAIFTALLNETASHDELAKETGNTRNNIDAIKHRCKNMVIKEARKIRGEWELLRQPGIAL